MAGIQRISSKRKPTKQPKKRTGIESLKLTGRYIEKSLEEGLRETTINNRPGYFRCSGIGQGARSLLFTYLGVGEQTFELRNIRYMDNGTKGHERWEDWLTKSGIALELEDTVLHPDLPITGRFDFIVKHPDFERLLLELKTTGSRKAKSLIMPDDEHLSQWMVYAHLKEIKYGFVIYEERDSLRPKYFPLMRDGYDLYIYTTRGVHIETRKNFLGDIYDKVEFVMWCAENNAFPKEECAPCNKWGCNYPDLCKKYEKDKEIVEFEKWRQKKFEDQELVK